MERILEDIKARCKEFEDSEAVVSECFTCIAGENYNKDIPYLLSEIDRLNEKGILLHEILQEVKELVNDRNAEIDRLQSQLDGWQRAEEDGLLHIAPCADGTPIYRILCEDEQDILCIYESIHCESYAHGFTEIVYGEFNKDWFLTEQAAIEAVELDPADLQQLYHGHLKAC